jgi:hypothetical protein
MTTSLPTSTHIVYNHSKLGFYGELGEGANAKVRFLETIINREDLDSITLISSIPGSETWEVRDLFQRDVDDERITRDIIPYFKDPNVVKYFNPITLILLPMSEDGREVIKNVEFIEPVSGTGDISHVYEKDNFYKFSIYKHDDPIGKIEWNDRKCFMVAIDGQHRISALKRWKSEPSSQFNDWKIPVIILSIFKVDETKPTASLLEIVRRTFVYINTKAERIDRAREILLNDESVNGLCTQELIQFTHDNDTNDLNDRDENILPLIFFDWQGRVEDKKRIFGPAAVVSVEEVYDWFDYYLLEDDGKSKQRRELELQDLIPPLQSYGPKEEKKVLTHEDATRIRNQFKRVMLPGILYLLNNVKPFKDYIASCREYEKKAIAQSDIAQHAFMKLRFGSHNAPQGQLSAVQAAYGNLTTEFQNLKKKFPYLIQNDIGFRGIMYAFSVCKSELHSIKGESMSWLECSKIFTEILNSIFEDNWFVGTQNIPEDKKDFLTHLVYDRADTIINYKLEQAKDGLGALLVLLVFKKLLTRGVIDEDDFESIWGDYSNVIRKTYEKSLRPYYKSVLNATWAGSITEFNAEVKRLADVESSNKIDKLYDFIINEE